MSPIDSSGRLNLTGEGEHDGQTWIISITKVMTQYRMT